MGLPTSTSDSRAREPGFLSDGCETLSDAGVLWAAPSCLLTTLLVTRENRMGSSSREPHRERPKGPEV